jgi:hypothetical protein
MAAALGAGWFVVLQISPWTSDWLRESARALPWNVAFLALSSVVMARLARPFILSAESQAADVGRAVLLPLAGCVVYLTLWNARSWIGGSAINLHDSLILYPWGVVAVALSFWVVVPYGYFCQRVMRRVLRDG